MSGLAKHRVLISGILSPLAAAVLYGVVYSALTWASKNHERDWLFRLSVATLAMLVPLLLTVSFAIRQKHRERSLTTSAKVGVFVALLGAGLALKPIDDGVLRWKQTRNQALRGVTAPVFDTVDLAGRRQRLTDYRGRVVLISLWATWCGPCRSEMPQLDRLYRERQGDGLVVFGMSTEAPQVQQKYLQNVRVSYPLLMVGPNVPAMYRDIARYPAMFLIDREGRLEPAPDPEQPFQSVQAAVDSLLKPEPMAAHR